MSNLNETAFTIDSSSIKFGNGVTEELSSALGRGRAKKGMFEGDLSEGEL